MSPGLTTKGSILGVDERCPRGRCITSIVYFQVDEDKGHRPPHPDGDKGRESSASLHEGSEAFVEVDLACIADDGLPFGKRGEAYFRPLEYLILKPHLDLVLYSHHFLVPVDFAVDGQAEDSL